MPRSTVKASRLRGRHWRQTDLISGRLLRPFAEELRLSKHARAEQRLGSALPRRNKNNGPTSDLMVELRTWLNVLAAIVSFAFLAAIVFGMF
jgi:hypothetical protein